MIGAGYRGQSYEPPERCALIAFLCVGVDLEHLWLKLAAQDIEHATAWAVGCREFQQDAPVCAHFKGY